MGCEVWLQKLHVLQTSGREGTCRESRVSSPQPKTTNRGSKLPARLVEAAAATQLTASMEKASTSQTMELCALWSISCLLWSCASCRSEDLLSMAEARPRSPCKSPHGSAHVPPGPTSPPTCSPFCLLRTQHVETTCFEAKQRGPDRTM